MSALSSCPDCGNLFSLDGVIDCPNPGHKLGSEQNPFTHDTGADRRRKWCRCAECGVVALCTPDHDFFIKDDGDPLRCESPCFWKYQARLGRPVPMSDMIKLTGGVA